jgi:CheY-like chemotaxis protein
MSKRILVVEGQKDNRQIIRDTLAGSDYQISEAEDGEQALVDRPRMDTSLRARTHARTFRKLIVTNRLRN